MAEPTTTKLDQLRDQHPDYDDLEDDELLELLHQANYSDIELPVFRQAMGVDVYTEETPTSTRQLEQPITRQTAIDKKLKSPDTFISNQAPDELESELKDFEDDDDQPGFLSNIGRRAGERAFDVVGDLFKGVTKAMEPIGRPADVAMAKLTTKPGLERDIAVRIAETRPNFFDVAADHMKAMDFGSVESETYDELEDKWSNAQGVGDYVSAFKDTVGWGITEGGASIPDMVAAVYALPAYVVSTDARIAQGRAENSGREDFTQEDMMIAAPAALGTVLFERFGAKYIAGKFNKSDEVLEEIGKTALERGLQVAKDAGASAGMEGFTEFVQEGIIEYVGETWGTEKQLDLMEGFQRGFWGSVAGGTFGGAAGAASSLAGEMGRAISGDSIPPEFETDPVIPPPEPDEDFGAELDEDLETEPPIDETIDEDSAPEPEPVDLPAVPGDPAEIMEQRRVATAEWNELTDLFARDPDNFPEASEQRLSELGDLMTELDTELEIANRAKYGPVDEVPIEETEAFDREQFDEAIDEVMPDEALEVEPGPLPEVVSDFVEKARQDMDKAGHVVNHEIQEIAQNIRKNIGDPQADEYLSEANRIMEEAITARPITEAPPVEGVPEDWKFFDPRMRHPGYREQLAGKMAEVLTDQGVGRVIRTPEYPGDPNPPVTGRVTSGNPPWVQSIIAEWRGVTGQQIRNAITKALEGKKLGSRQAAIVSGVLADIQAERNDPDTLQQFREELELRRSQRRDNKEAGAFDLSDDTFTDVFNDNVIQDPDAFWDLTEEEKLIGNLAVLLRAKGFDPTPIVDQSNSVEETVRRLEEALHDYEAGTEGLAEAGPIEAGGPRTETQEELLPKTAEEQRRQELSDELDRRRTDSGETDLSDLPLFGTPQDDIYDMPGVNARGEPAQIPAQIQDVESILEELSKVYPNETYRFPDESDHSEMMEEMTVMEQTPVEVVKSFAELNFEEMATVEEIYGQMLLARGNPTDDTQAPEDQRERRTDADLREAIEQMTPEERFEALYMDSLTGLGNRRYMEETMAGVPFFAFMDVDSLAVVNNYLGHAGGDKLLERVGEVIARLTDRGTAFHPHGDEYVLFGDSVEELEALTAQIDAELASSFVATEIGKLDGLSGTWGIDATIATADRLMEANKIRRIEMGERVERGAKPDNLEIAGTTQPEIQKAIMPMQPGERHVPMVGKYGDLPMTRDGGYRLSDGRVVRIPRRPVRKVHVLKRMQQRFGLSIWEGRIKGPRTELGYYKTPGGEIRTKFSNDLEVSAHEIGHWFDDRFPFISKLYNTAPFKKELKGVSYDVENVSEGFAEYFRLFFTQEAKAIEAAPYFHDAFMSELENNHAELYANIRDLQEMSHAWYLQGAEGRFDSKIGNPSLPLAIRWWDARHHASDFLLQRIFDGFRSWKQAERDIRGFVADAEHSPYKNMRMVKQSSELTEYAIQRGTINFSEDRREVVVTGESLKSALEGVDDQLDNWTRYAIAMRARELNGQGRESGFRPDEVKAGLAYGADPAIREAHARYLAWNDRMNDFYETTGILGPETREGMESMNRDYIPFNRVIEAFGTGKIAKPGGVFPRLKGSTRNIKDVLDSIVSNTSYLVHMALVNEAKQLMYDMIDASPVPQTAANWAVKVNKEVAPVPIQKEQIERAIVNGMGYDMKEWRLMKDGMVQDEFEQAIVEKVDQAIRSMDEFVTFWQLGMAPQGNIDIVYRQGEKHFYEIRDRLFMESIQHTSPKAMNLALRIAAGFSGTLRRGVVTWPGFQASNFLRDSMQAWTLAKGQKVPMVGAAKNVLKGFVDDTDYWAYILNGGGLSTLAEAEGEGQRMLDLGYKNTSPKQAWRNFRRLYDRKIGMLEYGNRINEYQRQINLGKSKREAAFAGREISTDFSMRGSSNTVRAATMSITFLNARMEGGYRLGRALFEIPPGQRPKFVTQTALTYFAKGMMIAIPSMILYLFNKDDERYQELPSHVKRMNWIMFYGEGEDDYVTVPKPFETGFFWGSMWEAMLEYLYENDEEELADAIGWMVMETFALDVIPQALKPIDELRTNKKWTGSPVIPGYLEGVEPELQYQHYTSDAMIKLGEKLNISPLAAQHLVEGYLGTSGQYALAVADFFTQDQANGGQEIAGPYREETDQELFEAWGRKYYEDLPLDIANSMLLHRFINHGPLKRTHSQEKFYDLLREARITANSVRLMQLRQPEKLAEYLKTVDEGFYFATSKSIESLAAEASKINTSMDRVAESPNMAPIAKRQMIEQLLRQRNLLFRNASQKLNIDDYEKTMEILNGIIPTPPEPKLN